MIKKNNFSHVVRLSKKRETISYNTVGKNNINESITYIKYFNRKQYKTYFSIAAVDTERVRVLWAYWFGACRASVLSL